MNTAELLAIIGDEIENRILSGNYGDASLHVNGYVVGDPCYSMKDASYQEMSTAARDQQPDAYHGRVREWVEFKWRESRCFFRSCSDGNGPLGHCLDAGWVCAIPVQHVSGWKKETVAA